jgi:hypothetical protein
MNEHADGLHVQRTTGTEWLYSPTNDVLDLIRIAEWRELIESNGEDSSSYRFIELGGGLKPLIRVDEEDGEEDND